MVTNPLPTPTDGPVTLIDRITVPAGEAERFLTRWHDSADAMARCPGFRGADVYRATDEETALQLVTVTQWDDEVALRSAQETEQVQEAFGRLVGDEELHIGQQPTVYQVAGHVPRPPS